MVMRAMVVVWACGTAGCGDRAGGVSDSATGRERVPPAAPASAPIAAEAAGTEGDRPATGCLRGGTPRDEVRRIMGEPDSVVWGSWLYGESEIIFGYGVIVETRNGGELPLCDGP